MRFNHSLCSHQTENNTNQHIKTFPPFNDRVNQENSSSELNQLYTKTSKITQEFQEDEEEVLLDCEIGNNSKIWSLDEILKMFCLYKEYGSRWTIIAKLINGKEIFKKFRSENSIKNKFNCSIRKFTRKLNKINKEAHTQFRKEIRTESVFRIIEATQLFPNMEEEMKKKSLEIRSMILLEAQKEEEAECSQNIIDLIDSINGFNLKTRSHKNPKHKRRKDIILFEPAKEFSNCCFEEQQIKLCAPSASSALSTPSASCASAESEQPCVEILSVKGDDHNCNEQDIFLEDKESSSANLSTFFIELETPDSDIAIPLTFEAMGTEHKNCYWSNFFNKDEDNIFEDEWCDHRM